MSPGPCQSGTGKLRRRALYRGHSEGFAVFCFVLFSLQLLVCLWWHDYHRDDFSTLKFGVVMADPLAIC